MASKKSAEVLSASFWPSPSDGRCGKPPTDERGVGPAAAGKADWGRATAPAEGEGWEPRRSSNPLSLREPCPPPSWPQVALVSRLMQCIQLQARRWALLQAPDCILDALPG